VFFVGKTTRVVLRYVCYMYTIKQIVSVLALANQLIAQFGTDETEQQCEHNFCPELVNKIDGHIDIITGLVCGAVCKEYVGKQQFFLNVT